MAETTLPGKGKYGDEAELIMAMTGAKALVLLVLGGDRGGGMSVSLEWEYEVMGKGKSVLLSLPQQLRDLANQIEKGNAFADAATSGGGPA
jgi:hypothetical protein